jgi:rubrerythrin
MGPMEALNLALSKEIEAMELYQKFSASSDAYPATKEIFIFLAHEEFRHKQLIEEKITELQKRWQEGGG